MNQESDDRKKEREEREYLQEGGLTNEPGNEKKAVGWGGLRALLYLFCLFF